MAQSFCYWLPAGLRATTEKTRCRRGCCDLLRFCSGRAQIPGSSPGPACVHEAVKLLEELLADGGCPRAVSCRCEDALQDPFPFSAALSMFLPRRCEAECRPRGASRSPCRLLRGLCLQMALTRRWDKMMAAVPWIQDLLEVSCAALVPRPRGMCLSCRGRQEVLSEVSASQSHKPSHRPSSGRRSEERRAAASLCRYLCNPEKTGDGGVSGAEERSDRRRRPGLLSSAQQLKDSLKKDLETHQLYLGAIETRLRGLERRARDVTRRLESANLELEAIKHGSVALKTLADGPVPPPGTEGLLWEELSWIGGTVKSARPGLCRRKDPESRSARGYPAGGGSEHTREDVRTGLSSCHWHVDVLIQQITRQINQMERDMKAGSVLHHSAR